MFCGVHGKIMFWHPTPFQSNPPQPCHPAIRHFNLSPPGCDLWLKPGGRNNLSFPGLKTAARGSGERLRSPASPAEVRPPDVFVAFCSKQMTPLRYKFCRRSSGGELHPARDVYQWGRPDTVLGVPLFLSSANGTLLVFVGLFNLLKETS